jgi:hypothetical protein
MVAPVLELTDELLLATLDVVPAPPAPSPCASTTAVPPHAASAATQSQ